MKQLDGGRRGGRKQDGQAADNGDGVDLSSFANEVFMSKTAVTVAADADSGRGNLLKRKPSPGTETQKLLFHGEFDANRGRGARFSQKSEGHAEAIGMIDTPQWPERRRAASATVTARENAEEQQPRSAGHGWDNLLYPISSSRRSSVSPNRLRTAGLVPS
ncbi:hypothetical protein [Paracoccus aminovorans]|uniref:hypothetical protein n=1 Tax=Paracoccus aminovorans TaxID=34004 RepID=UPI0012E35C5F|nr:hypothetical protein [Paracoccus aminovorans]MDQ7777105.1 hypothetical protein [Paracoccus aminovorans]